LSSSLNINGGGKLENLDFQKSSESRKSSERLISWEDKQNALKAQVSWKSLNYQKAKTLNSLEKAQAANFLDQRG
jgi:hypothetical protein